MRQFQWMHYAMLHGQPWRYWYQWWSAVHTGIRQATQWYNSIPKHTHIQAMLIRFGRYCKINWSYDFLGQIAWQSSIHPTTNSLQLVASSVVWFCSTTVVAFLVSCMCHLHIHGAGHEALWHWRLPVLLSLKLFYPKDKVPYLWELSWHLALQQQLDRDDMEYYC